MSLLEEILNELAGNPQDKEPVGDRAASIKTYRTVGRAIRQGQYGDIFTTPRSKANMYVITRSKWGDKSTRHGRGKVYKSFKKDTPLEVVKTFSDRTKIRHGKHVKEPQGAERRQQLQKLIKKKKDAANVN